MERNLSQYEFARLFTSFESSAFRLETLPQYAVGDEEQGYKLYLQGEVNLPEEHAGWCSIVRENTLAGKKMSRVHLLPARLTPYLRFEIDRWYQFTSQAGEDIRLLLDKDTSPDMRRILKEDFWLFDGKNVVTLQYDDHGAYKGATLISGPEAALEYSQLRDLALEKSINLKSFLSMYRQGQVD